MELDRPVLVCTASNPSTPGHQTMWVTYMTYFVLESLVHVTDVDPWLAVTLNIRSLRQKTQQT